MNVGGAVLVGGASTRMGADKAMLAVDGVPMAIRVGRALKDGGCAEVAIVGGDPAARSGIGMRHIADAAEFAGWGPVAGVVAALEDGAANNYDAVVVAACDLPDLDEVAVRILIEASRGGSPQGTSGVPEFHAVVASSASPDGEPQRHSACALWPVSGLPALRAHLGAPGVRRSLHAALDAIGAVDIDLGGRALLNANTPHDIADRAAGSS